MPRPASLSPELLNTFITIIRTEGDATLAAEILKINQPSMSKRLAFLQHAGRILRRPWIDRVGKSWHITEEGKRVLPAVEELVRRYRLLADAIDDKGPDIVFGVGASTAVKFARRVCDIFRKGNAGASVRVTQRSAKDRVEGVANGSLDLAVVRMAEGDIRELAHRPLHVETLWDDPLVLVSNSDSFYGDNDDKPTPKTIAKLPLVLPPYDQPLRIEFDRKCRDAGMGERLNVVAEVGPWSTMIDYAKDGYGVCLLPKSAVEGMNKLVVKPLPNKLAPLTKTSVITRTVAGSDDLELNDLGKAFLSAIRSAAKDI